jgi:hypothetical protein
MIININAIKYALIFSNNRLKVSTKTTIDKEIIVSKETVSAFKDWLVRRCLDFHKAI